MTVVGGHTGPSLLRATAVSIVSFLFLAWCVFLISIMFSNFRNSDLAMIALALDEEEKEETLRRRRKRTLVDSAWKLRPIEGEFNTLV